MSLVTVPTGETASISFWVELLLRQGRSSMLVGGAGQIKLTKDGAVLLKEMQIMRPTAPQFSIRSVSALIRSPVDLYAGTRRRP